MKKWTILTSLLFLLMTGIIAQEVYLEVQFSSQQGNQGIAEADIDAACTAIGKSAEDITYLTVTGTVELGNNHCLAIRTKLVNVKTMDLSGARFVYGRIPPQGSGGIFNSMIVEKVILPNDVNEVGDRAFRLCKNLKEINLPDGITKIGVGAFVDCEELQLTRLPAALATISDWAFQRALKLELTTLPWGVNVIGRSAFDLTKVSFKDIPAGVTIIGTSAFRGSNISEITFPSLIEQIGSTAFRDCASLSTLIFKGYTPPAVDVSEANHTFYGLDLSNISVQVPSAEAVEAFNVAPWNLMKQIGVTSVSRLSKPLFNLYPAITSDNIQLKDVEKSGTGVIYNSNGTVVQTFRIETGETYTIPVKHFPSGIYLFKVGDGTHRFIKQ